MHTRARAQVRTRRALGTLPSTIVHSINPFLFNLLICVTISRDISLHISRRIGAGVRTARFKIQIPVSAVP